MDVAALENLIQRVGRERVPLVMLTVTNNSGGGQPVSMENVRQVSAVCRKHRHPALFRRLPLRRECLLHQAARKGIRIENAQSRLRRKCFGYGDGCTMSAKKDGMANIGGFLCTNDDLLAQQEKDLLILTEGYPTYGGLAGRDLEAIAVGVTRGAGGRLPALSHRLNGLSRRPHRGRRAFPSCSRRAGTRSTSMRARSCRTFRWSNFPAVALACELYLEGGIRSVEIGPLMFGAAATMDLVRLAIPRRVYTQSHIDYVVEIILGSLEETRLHPRTQARLRSAVPAALHGAAGADELRSPEPERGSLSPYQNFLCNSSGFERPCRSCFIAGDIRSA